MADGREMSEEDYAAQYSTPTPTSTGPVPGTLDYLRYLQRQDPMSLSHDERVYRQTAGLAASRGQPISMPNYASGSAVSSQSMQPAQQRGGTLAIPQEALSYQSGLEGTQGPAYLDPYTNKMLADLIAANPYVTSFTVPAGYQMRPDDEEKLRTAILLQRAKGLGLNPFVNTMFGGTPDDKPMPRRMSMNMPNRGAFTNLSLSASDPEIRAGAQRAMQGIKLQPRKEEWYQKAGKGALAAIFAAAGGLVGAGGIAPALGYAAGTAGSGAIGGGLAGGMGSAVASGGDPKQIAIGTGIGGLTGGLAGGMLGPDSGKLARIGTGIGLGAAGSAGTQAAQGQEIDPWKVASSGVAGGVGGALPGGWGQAAKPIVGTGIGIARNEIDPPPGPKPPILRPNPNFVNYATRHGWDSPEVARLREELRNRGFTDEQIDQLLGRGAR